MRYAIICVGLVLAGCNVSTFSKIEASRPIPLTNTQMAQIKATVTRDFFDPESAQFRGVQAVEVSLADGTQERRVCGEVNGKNRMGGYVGYSMFGGSLENGKFVKRDFFAPCRAW